MRGRKAGLLPLEVALLECALAFREQGTETFHGFAASNHLREATGSDLFVTHGALYKALGRLEGWGFLQSTWEDPEFALLQGRPRRRLYRITAEGEAAFAEATALSPARLRVAPT